ncbi:MAG: ABC transporter ATP-binding protein [Phycisphaerae bacterium]
MNDPTSTPPTTGPDEPPTSRTDNVLVRVRDLRVRFPVRKGLFGRVTGWVRAVDGVGFDIPAGTTLGLVGESGCGKTTVARAILRLVEPEHGSVAFDGVDVLGAAKGELRRLRRHMQLVFQDPFGSLNPRLRVGGIIAEPLAIHRLARGARRTRRVAELLASVGLRDGDASRYPHEFSGGQRQRIGIARAIAPNPRFVICDEPVSALDVSIQAQILNLLRDLQESLGLTYLFIAHNLAVVKHFSDRVAVMYLGKIVEHAAADAIYTRPGHPYTIALLAAVPEPDPTTRGLDAVLAGDLPSPIDPPPGCTFHTRCPFVTDKCRTVTPRLEHHASFAPDHVVACHHAAQIAHDEAARRASPPR